MGKQYLTFKLADTVYAVNVFQVREVLSYTAPQPLPKSDPVIEGLIRSRGQSIPVVNLRRKFSLADKQPDAASRIIVVEVNNYEEGSVSVFGAVADSVNEVLDLDTIGFEDTPELGNSPASAFIEGIGRQDDSFIIILDVDKIFSHPELLEMNELDNRTVAPEYAQYTQELPPQRHEPTPVVGEPPRPELEETPQTEETAPVYLEPGAELSVAEPVQEAQAYQVLPTIKTPPIEEEQAQAVQAETEVPTQEASLEPASSPLHKEEIAQGKRQSGLLYRAAQVSSNVLPDSSAPPQQAQKEPPQEDTLDGRYDALDFAPEDFELL